MFLSNWQKTKNVLNIWKNFEDPTLLNNHLRTNNRGSDSQKWVFVGFYFVKACCSPEVVLTRGDFTAARSFELLPGVCWVGRFYCLFISVNRWKCFPPRSPCSWLSSAAWQRANRKTFTRLKWWTAEGSWCRWRSTGVRWVRLGSVNFTSSSSSSAAAASSLHACTMLVACFLSSHVTNSCVRFGSVRDVPVLGAPAADVAGGLQSPPAAGGSSRSGLYSAFITENIQSEVFCFGSDHLSHELFSMLGTNNLHRE